MGMGKVPDFWDFGPLGSLPFPHQFGYGAAHLPPWIEAYGSGVKTGSGWPLMQLAVWLIERPRWFKRTLLIVNDLEKQHRDFFDLVREHTMEGYYGSPRHGGNRDAVSWRMLGLDEPPLRGRAQYDLRKGGQS